MAKQTNRQSASRRLRDGKLARRGSLQEQQAQAQGISLDPGEPRRGRRGVIGHKVNPKSLQNLKKGGAPAAIPASAPSLTDARAQLFVKFRAAGVSPTEAAMLCAHGDEELTLSQWEKIGKEWEKADRVKNAWADFHGGKWEDLDEDTRTDVALSYHVAQCARVLLTSDITDPAENMKKVAYAKDVIVEKLTISREGAEGNKFDAFMQQLVANANAGLPGVFKSPSGGVLPALPALPANMGGKKDS